MLHPQSSCIDLIAAYKHDPQRTEDALRVWFWELVETRSQLFQWWQPTRRTLAEVFNTTPDSPAADITAAREYFSNHPQDLVVADVSEPGRQAPIEYQILRYIAPQSVLNPNHTNRSLPAMEWLWQRIEHDLIPLIHNRLVKMLVALGSRLPYREAGPSTGRLLREITLSTVHFPVAWYVSQGGLDFLTTEISETELRRTLGIPLLVQENAGMTDVMLCRSELSGPLTVVPESLNLNATLVPGRPDALTMSLEIWGGAGIDTSLGHAGFLRLNPAEAP